MPAPTPAAERMRRYRERQRSGTALFKFELSRDILDELVRAGLLMADDIQNDAALQFALGMLFENFLKEFSLRRNGPANSERIL